MKSPILLALFAVLLFSACSSDDAETTTVDNPQLLELTEENRRLRAEMAEKDSTVGAFFEAMNEIETNLLSIYEKEGNIAAHRLDDVELAGDAKERITNEINAINELMASNRKKISALYSRLENANADISSFKAQVERLEEMIGQKDTEIVMLRDELAGMNVEMEMLYTENEDMIRQMELQDEEMNSAWFAYGTSKELREAGVITKDGGFIGLGRVERLSDDFNKEYFTAVNIERTTEIALSGKSAELVTTHAKGSYEFVGEDGVTGLNITNPQEFWSASKYLVIVVD